MLGCQEESKNSVFLLCDIELPLELSLWHETPTIKPAGNTVAETQVLYTHVANGQFGSWNWSCWRWPLEWASSTALKSCLKKSPQGSTGGVVKFVNVTGRCETFSGNSLLWVAKCDDFRAHTGVLLLQPSSHSPIGRRAWNLVFSPSIVTIENRNVIWN